MNISIKTLTRGKITHLVVDSTGLQVFGEGEWKIWQYGVDKGRVYGIIFIWQWIVRHMKLSVPNLSGSNNLWKKKVGYHRRSLAETAMFRFKTLLGGHLSLHDYDAQVGEAMAMVKALNRITLLGMLNSVRIV